MIAIIHFTYEQQWQFLILLDRTLCDSGTSYSPTDYIGQPNPSDLIQRSWISWCPGAIIVCCRILPELGSCNFYFWNLKVTTIYLRAPNGIILNTFLCIFKFLCYLFLLNVSSVKFQLKTALAEAHRNSNLLMEYQELYELQRKRLEKEIKSLSEETELWCNACYTLANKVSTFIGIHCLMFVNIYFT